MPLPLRSLITPVIPQHILNHIPFNIASPKGIVPLRPFFESIIQKRVNLVALTIFESIVNFFCTKFYAAYKQRIAYCIQIPSVISQTHPTSKKILQFIDGAQFFDRTSTHRIEIKQMDMSQYLSLRRINTQCPSQIQEMKIDQLFIDGKPVYFSNIPSNDLFFGKKYGTQEMYGTDIKECPELVVIYEREISGNLKAWSVDTTAQTLNVSAPSPFFIAEEIK